MKNLWFAMICIVAAVILTIGISCNIATKAQPSGFVKSAVIFYWSGDLQQQIVADIIHRQNPRLSETLSSQITTAIFKESREFGLDPFLVTGVIAAESSFRPNAVSPCNAMGLMQLTRGVSNALHLNPFDIEQNIHGGSRYLHYLKKRFKMDELMLAAYNAGPTRVARLKRVPRIPETICYIRKIGVLRQIMSGAWNTVMQNMLKNPVILPLSVGLFADCQQSSLGTPVKSVNFGCQMLRAASYPLAISHPILDNKRLNIFG